MDWDNDGLHDLLVGDTGGNVHIYLNTINNLTPALDGNIIIYINEGTDAAPVFNSYYYMQLSSGADFDIGSRAAPRIIDWNNDGLKDLLVGEDHGYIYFLKNAGTNAEPLFNDLRKLELQTGEPLRYLPAEESISRLAVADWNNDGYSDILVGGGDGRVMLFLAEP